MSQTATLTIPYAGTSVPNNPWWVRLEQIPPVTDVADVSSTADMLDELYKTEPCTTVEQPEEAEELTTEDVEAAASKTLDIVACLIEPDGSCEVQIKVIRSHQIEPYRLHVAGGSVVSTVVVNEETTQYVSVSSATEATLEYPLVDAFAAAWMADVTTDSGHRPTINRNGNVLYWTEAAAGTLRAAYLTVYDLVTVKVDGVNGEQGEALIRVVFHAMAEELTPELPEPAEMDRSLCRGRSFKVEFAPDRVTCYKTITHQKLCSCSGKEALENFATYSEIDGAGISGYDAIYSVEEKTVRGRYTYDQVVPCPEWLTGCHNSLPECMALLGSETIYEYVECAGDNQVSGTGHVWAVSSPEYYKETCCTDPTVALPQCYEKTSSYRGGQDIVNGRQFWRDLYGPSTEFRPVSPPGGVCGEHITRQVVESNNCCDGVPALAWDASVSPEVMAPNSSAVFGVTGGRPPFRWTISDGLMIDGQMDGNGFSFANGSNQVYTEGRQLYVVTSADACGSVTLTVEDGCSTATGGIRCTSGRWVMLGSFYPATIYDPKSHGFIPKLVNGYAYSSTGDGEIRGRYCITSIPSNPAPGNEAWSYVTWSTAGQFISCFDPGPVITMLDPIVGVFTLEIVQGSHGPLYGGGYCPADIWYRPMWLNSRLTVLEWTC